MAEQEVSFLEDDRLSLLLFGGKGGVGKTTAAAATALYRARRRPDRSVLVISTDPAHSLSDCLNQTVGDRMTPIAGLKDLVALELDAERLGAEFKREHEAVLNTILDRGTYFDQDDIVGLLDLSLPGLDELMAVIEVADIVRERRYDLVILDTAPTGHTLRMLGLSEVLVRWLHLFDLMLEKHRYMMKTLGGTARDEATAFLEDMSANLERLSSVLRDEVATEFVLVTIPEPMAVEETSRMLKHLRELHVHVRSILVNRIVTQSECPVCETRRAGQVRHLREIADRFSAYDLYGAPLMDREVRGRTALRKYITAISGFEAFAAQAPTSRVVETSQTVKTGPETPAGPALAPLQLVLFGGKGGVGKTTMAAATALHLSKRNPGTRILLFSTDPAHSLSDSLDQQVGDTITAIRGVDGLFALEVDADRQLDDLKRDYRSAIDELLNTGPGGSFDMVYDRQVMEQLITLTPPGLDELMGLITIMDLMEKGEFDRYVMDMAPTGHALRFLEMPGVVRSWFMTLFRLFVKYKGVVKLPEIVEMLRMKSKQFRKLQELLVDSDRCQFVTVAIPEAMCVLETQRLLADLAKLSVTCRLAIVNMVVPPSECASCSATRDEQQRSLKALQALTAVTVRVPLLSQEVRGLPALSTVAGIVFGGNAG